MDQKVLEDSRAELVDLSQRHGSAGAGSRMPAF